MTTPTTEKVQQFWNSNPLCAWQIPYPKGSREYFEYFDKIRIDIEKPDICARMYKFENFSGKKVLEVGCGNGYVLSRYAAKGAHTTGIDLTETAVELSKKRFELAGLPGTFLVADAQQLPFPDNSFDCVCSMGVLHHVPDTAQAVSEIYRVLKPGGRLVIMMYHRNSVLYRWKFPLLKLLTGKFIQQLVNEVDGAGNPKGDVYSKSELRELLGRFQDIEMHTRSIEGWMVLPKLGFLIPKKLLALFEKHWGWFLYAAGRKGDQ